MTLCPLQFSKMDLLRITLLERCGETDSSGRFLVLDGDTVSSVTTSDELYEPSDIERTGASGRLAGVSYADPTVKWVNVIITVNGVIPELEVLLMGANPHMSGSDLIGYDRCAGPSNAAIIEPIYVEDEGECDVSGDFRDIWNLFPYVSRWTRTQDVTVDGQTGAMTQYTGRARANKNFDNPHGGPWTVGGMNPTMNVNSCFSVNPFAVSNRPTADCAFQTIEASS